MAGSLFIVSAPSGAGKTSLVRALLDHTPGLMVSVSHTTRPIRPGELDGDDYRFVSSDAFQQMIAAGAFLEYAQVFDRYYGTSRDTVLFQLEQGVDVVLEIDWQGARQVRAAMPEARSIFVLPPSRQALAQRLRARGQDSEPVIARRMRDAVAEMSHYEEFDNVIVNDSFDAALRELDTVIRAERLTLRSQADVLGRLLAELLAQGGG